MLTMLAVSPAGEHRAQERSGAMGVVTSAKGSERARLNAISVEVEGCGARLATGVRR